MAFQSRYRLELSHDDIEKRINQIVEAGVIPLSVGGDHSISHPILKAVGRKRPVGMIHIDAHCDTGGAYDLTKFHHGGPFRNAVLDGVLDPTRTIQIGIRGSSGISLGVLLRIRHDRSSTPRKSPAWAFPPSSRKRARSSATARPTSRFDVDSLDPSFAPGTGTPEIGGLTTREVLELLRGLKGLNIVGGDVVEVAPQYDATTNTARTPARRFCSRSCR